MGERPFSQENKLTSRTLSSELLQGSSLVHHEYYDPFMKAFEIQTSEGLIKRYKLTSTRDKKDAQQTMGETLTASTDESSEVTSVEKGKMVRLQKQLLEIRKKQGEYQKRMKEERQKVASLEARNRELEMEVSAGESRKDGMPLTKHQVIAGASQFLKEPVLSFFMYQINRTDGEPARWNKEMRKLSLELYEKSPSAYNLLVEIFALPSVESLQAWIDGEDSLEEYASRTGDTAEGFAGIVEEPAANLENVVSSVALDNSRDTDVAVNSEDVAKFPENSKEVEDIARSCAEVLVGNPEASSKEMKSANASNEDLLGDTSKLFGSNNENNGATENKATSANKDIEVGSVTISETNDVRNSNTDSDIIKLPENMEDSESRGAVRPKSPETVIVYLDCLHPSRAKKRKL